MRARLLPSLLLATTALSPLSLLADPTTLPEGGQISHGAVGFSRSGPGQMAINQGSQAAIVNWGSFSVGSQARVDIRQPGPDAMLLNRVTGSATSQIDGQITANGQVFLVNPNGIMIGPNGQIQAAGFVASTLDIDDDDFVQGRLRFHGTGASGTVRNAGMVDIVPGGYAALIGGRVANSGTIRVPMGRVGMGAGERVTLDFSGDGFLQVALPSDIDGDEALVSNSGRIEADGGRVEMLAATARDAARNAVNLSGVVEARSVSGRNGAIMLGGGAGGQVRVTGRATTRAPAIVVDRSPVPPPRPTGGDITITGAEIILAGAQIDASGPGGGGAIRIGGDFYGAGDLPTAQRLGVDGETRILSNALELGDGGTVALWSDDFTVFRGEIEARGGDAGGDGGFVEVSGKARLSFAGLVDRRAPLGRAGLLLLDPYDVTIGVGDTDGGVFLVAEGGPLPPTFDFAPSATPAFINVGTLVTNLNLGDVFVQTGSAGDGVPGDGTITVLSEIAWTSSSNLTFSAVGNVDILQAITAPSGGLIIDAGGVITTGDDGAVNVARFTLNAGDWQQINANLPGFQAGDFRIPTNDAAFLRALGGDGSAGLPFLLADVYGLQGIDTRLSDNFALANDIDASVTSGWNSGLGFKPVGGPFIEDSFAPFEGSIDGRGFTISNLIIDRPSTFVPIGLVVENAGTITNLRLSSPSVIGGFGPTGTIAGINSGINSISRVVIEDAVVFGDGDAIGGLVGINSGLIEQATVAATVTGGGLANGRGSVDLGGLAGTNTGTIRQSRSAGTIRNTGNSSVGFSERFEAGGLVGANFGLIEQSRADVDIFIGPQPGGGFETTGRAESGGLVGRNYSNGVLRDVAATGNIRSISDTDAGVGGLVGTNDGTIERAYASGGVRGSATNSGFTEIGGLVGTNRGTIIQGLATGSVGADDVFVPGDPFTSIGGLVGMDSSPGGVGTDSFWDSEATGQMASAGSPDANGLTTAALQDFEGFQSIASAVGWNFANHWSPSEPGFYAQLYAIDPVAQVTSETMFDVVYGELETETAEREVTTNGGPGVYVFGPEFGNPDAFLTLGSFAAPSDLNVGLRDAAVEGLRSVNPDLTTAQDYRPVTGFATFNITPAPLTITADPQSKVYGDVAALGTTAFTAEGLVYSDSVVSVTLDSEGANTAAPVGEYDLIASNPVGTGLANYIITFIDGTLTVTPAPLTITADDRQKFFGEELDLGTTAFTNSGLRNDDRVDSVLLFSEGAPADAPIEGSPFTINIASPIGIGLENYVITLQPGQLEVFPVESEPPPPPAESEVVSPSLVTPVFDMPNPRDDFTGLDLRDRSTSATPAVSGQSETAAEAQQVLGALNAAANGVEDAMQACRQESPAGSELLDCIANALGTYANVLEELALDLPAELAQVSAIIRQAQTGVAEIRTRTDSRLATATTDTQRRQIEREAIEEAVDVVRGAAEEVRRAIELIRADDPQLVSVFSAQGATVTRALESVEIELVRAIGI